MLSYELRKLFSPRWLRVLVVVFLLLNAVLCLYTTRYADESVPDDDVLSLFAWAAEDAAGVQAAYAEIRAEQEAADALWQEQMQAGNYDYEPPVPPNRYVTDDRYTDAQLFAVLYRHIDAIQSYDGTVSAVIRQAERNLTEFDAMGIAPDAFVCKLQNRNIAVYSALLDTVEIGFEYIRGWDTYLTYGTGNLCMAAVLLLFASVLFTEEERCGILPLLRTCRRGRGETARWKLLALFVVTVGTVLVFSLESFAVFGLRLGYSSPFNVVQAVGLFALCPYAINILTYAVLQVLLRCLVLFAFALAVALISVFSYHYAVVYVGGLGILGVNVLLDGILSLNADAPAKLLNLLSAADTTAFFERLRVSDVFGAAVDTVWLAVAGYTLVSLLFGIGIVVKFMHSAAAVRITLPGWAVSLRRRIADIWGHFSRFRLHFSARGAKKAPRRSLFGWEWHKMLIAARVLPVILLLFCVRCALSADAADVTQTFSDAVYEDYMTRWQGELTDTARAEIAAERAYISETLSEETEVRLSYLDGEISYHEYAAWLVEYNYAFTHAELFCEIEDHVLYVDRMAAAGYGAWFVYDTGWEALLFSDFDFTLYAAFLLLFAGVFAVEYDTSSSNGGFSQILRCAKRGRRATFRAKYSAAIVASLCFSVLWNVADIAFVSLAYPFPSPNAPVLSLESCASLAASHSPLAAFAADMSIAGFFALVLLLRILSSVLLAVLLCALSALLRRLISVLATAMLLTVFPALLSYFGFSSLSFLDFTALLRGHTALLSHTRPELLLLGCVTVCVFLSGAAYRRFCK